MDNSLTVTKGTSYSKILSLISAIFFLIGSVYYSYIHIETAYSSMHTIINTKLPDGTNATSWEFRFSNLNLPAVLSCLLAILLGVLTVFIFVLAFKDKLHILSAVLSAGIIVLQFIIEGYTRFEEYYFARFVLCIDRNWTYSLAFPIKYVPFSIAFLLSVICGIMITYAHKRKESEI